MIADNTAPWFWDSLGTLISAEIANAGCACVTEKLVVNALACRIIGQETPAKMAAAFHLFLRQFRLCAVWNRDTGTFRFQADPGTPTRATGGVRLSIE